MKFLIVTGLSGAGKTNVLKHLEDNGYQCIDNLPPMLLKPAFALCESAQPDRRVALGVDSRSGVLFDAQTILAAIEDSRDRNEVNLLFIEANAETLIARYKETRRDHPLARDGMTLEEAIALEYAMLQPLREHADLVLSTSGLNASQINAQLDKLLFEDHSQRGMRTEVMSFGYKRGIPRESDLVFDVRFLPNPYYIHEIRAYTGLESPVRDYVLGRSETRAFLERLYAMIDLLLPLYQREGKRRLMIAVGCTGGAHRSVVIAEALCAHIRGLGNPASVIHRDIALEEASWPFKRKRA